MTSEYHQAPDSIPKANRPIFDEGHNTAKVKIVGGMSEHALQDPPAVGESRTYIVKATCKEHHVKEIDGELRLVCDMEQTSIYERGKVPIVDGPEPGLFDADTPPADAPDEDEAPAQGELGDEPDADEPEDNVRTGPWSGPDSPTFSGADSDEDEDGNQS